MDIIIITGLDSTICTIIQCNICDRIAGKLAVRALQTNMHVGIIGIFIHDECDSLTNIQIDFIVGSIADVIRKLSGSHFGIAIDED